MFLKGSVMSKVVEILPDFFKEVTDKLHAIDSNDFAKQLPELELAMWTYDTKAKAIYIYFSNQKGLNIVEQNVIGTKFNKSLELTGINGVVVLDIDNFERLMGIEIIARPDIEQKLRNFCPPSKD
jgi:uncharacterized protein YuzE